MIGSGFGRGATYRLNREYVASSDIASSDIASSDIASSDVASSPDSIVNSTVESTFGSKNQIEGQVNDDLGQEKGQENRSGGQENQDLRQVNSAQVQETDILGQVNEIVGQVNKQENLSDKQKEILIYLLKHPSDSLKNCSAATGASAKSIRYTFRKVSSWLDIYHERPDKTGIWRFQLK